MLHRLRCPILAVQGESDEYGTLAQWKAFAGARRRPKSSCLRIAVIRRSEISPKR